MTAQASEPSYHDTLRGPLDETEQGVLAVLEKFAGYRELRPEGVTQGRWLIVDSRGCAHFVKEALAEWRAIRADMLTSPGMPAEDVDDVQELVKALAALLSLREEQEHVRKGQAALGRGQAFARAHVQLHGEMGTADNPSHGRSLAILFAAVGRSDKCARFGLAPALEGDPWIARAVEILAAFGLERVR